MKTGAKNRSGRAAAVKPSAAGSMVAECQRVARQGCYAVVRRAVEVASADGGTPDEAAVFRMGLACMAGVLRGVMAACADRKGGAR